MALATEVLPDPVPPAMATTRTGFSKRFLVGEMVVSLDAVAMEAISYAVVIVDVCGCA